MRIFCIINARSGTAKKFSSSYVAQLFASHGLASKIVESKAGDSITSLTKDATEEGFEVIVAGGGDGTVNAVASAIVGNTAIKLGVIPMGTFNHFARDLGIPNDVAKAVEIIAAGHFKSVDVGKVNDNIFVNNSSLGIYPAIVRLREGLQKSGHNKIWAAVWASIRIITRFRRLRLELHPANEPVFKRNTVMLFVGNNTYETSLAKLGTRLSLDRGRLWITMPTMSTRWGLISNLISILTAREKLDEVLTFETTDLVVNTNHRLVKVAVDGEVLHLLPPLNYRSLPKSLQVIVPKPMETG